MTERQPDSLFEVKVPIFCEFIFQKNLALSNVEVDGTTFSKYISDILAKPNCSRLIECDEYVLPGFPGIKYQFRVCVDQLTGLDFAIDVDYATCLFDIDYTYTINNNEPKHFHDTFDSGENDEYKTYFLLDCSDECAGCAACKDKILVVQVEGYITVKHVNHLRISFDVAREDLLLRDKNDTKDFVFVVEEKEIQVHKSILIKNSTVFERMLDSDKWKETTENKIVIPEFSYNVMEFVIKTLYGNTYFDDYLENEEYLMLFRFADKYDMDKLKKAAQNAIVLTPSTVVEYANFLLQNNFDELVDYCIDYILVCSQNSLPIKDIENLDARIRSVFFDRVLISPVLKKDLKIEHRTVFDAKE